MKKTVIVALHALIPNKYVLIDTDIVPLFCLDENGNLLEEIDNALFWNDEKYLNRLIERMNNKKRAGVIEYRLDKREMTAEEMEEWQARYDEI